MVPLAMEGIADMDRPISTQVEWSVRCEALVPRRLPAWRKGQSPSNRLDFDHTDPAKQEGSRAYKCTRSEPQLV